jgi:hypothetical protein
MMFARLLHKEEEAEIKKNTSSGSIVTWEKGK